MSDIEEEERKEAQDYIQAKKESAIKELKVEKRKDIIKEMKNDVKKKVEMVKSGRFLMTYKEDKFFMVDKFSDLVMNDNFAKKDDGQRKRENHEAYNIKRKYGITPFAVNDLRFLSDEAKEEQEALVGKIIERMEMSQEEIDYEMINEAQSSMLLTDGGNQNQVSSVLLVLLEIKGFRKFALNINRKLSWV